MISISKFLLLLFIWLGYTWLCYQWGYNDGVDDAAPEEPDELFNIEEIDYYNTTNKAWQVLKGGDKDAK